MRSITDSYSQYNNIGLLNNNKNNIIDEAIRSICRYEYSMFLCKKNVVGIGLGYKTIKGFNTCEKCIKVFVTNKVAKCELDANNIIPICYKGLKTDVVSTGSTIKPCSLTGKVRPVIGGYSVSPLGTTEFITGTVGCLVTDDEKIYMLGCNHIFANENQLMIGTTIIQPALMDGGVQTTDKVASLSKFIPLQFITPTEVPENLVDCAIAEVVSADIASPDIAFVGKPLGVDTVGLIDKVIKVGRTTELTESLVIATDFTGAMTFEGGEILFKDQIVTLKMSQGGDSGAILLNDKNYAVGLIFADTDSNSFANPIQAVLDSLNVKLVTA